MTQYGSAGYWQDKCRYYIDTIKTSYQVNRLEMIHSLLADVDLACSVLDFGCGDGVIAEVILEAGGAVLCVDIETIMISATEERLARKGFGKDKFSVLCGGVECLSGYSDNSFDLVLALNVLAYMRPDEEDTFYKESYRILRPTGKLIVTHSNELFDLFTFNKYTVNFFRKHFSDYASMDNIGSLISYPDLPDRTPLPIRENPLSYRFKLKSYGFKEVQQEFAILHPLPPLLMKNFDPDNLENRECLDTTKIADSEKWKLMFMCSIFGSKALSLKDSERVN